MTISLVRQNGKSLYGVKDYVLDTIEDLENLPVSDATGSTAFVIEGERRYILNSQNQWVALSGSGSTTVIDDSNIESISNQQIDTWFDEE